MNWYIKVVKNNYANFTGRARRKEYWLFVFFNLSIGIILAVVDRTFELSYGTYNTGLIESIYSLAVTVPTIAVIVRRLHDTGKSGWNFLLVFTIIGILYVLYLLIKEGDFGLNKYGEDPKIYYVEGSIRMDIKGTYPYCEDNYPFSKDDSPHKSND